MTDASFARLEKLLGYGFRDRRLLAKALTHASHPEVSNERLEFLGDAVLNLVAAEELYQRFPEEREGRLTEIKGRIVARQTLNRIGGRLGLGEFLRTGASLEGRSPLPNSLLGNALEAVLGAVYLDCGGAGGLEQARKLAMEWLEPEWSGARRILQQVYAKQSLQVYAQRIHGAPPAYPVLESVAHPITAAFKVAAEFGGRQFPPAWGTNKREAEKWAAFEALLILRAEGRLEPPTKESA